jgi:hypothetical protein
MRPKRRAALLIALFVAVIAGLFIVIPKRSLRASRNTAPKAALPSWRQGIGVVKAFPVFGAGNGFTIGALIASVLIRCIRRAGEVGDA